MFIARVEGNDVQLLSMLPRGATLPEDRFRPRHKLLVGLLWLHVPLLGIIGVAAGYGVRHMAIELVAPILLAVLGMRVSNRVAKSVLVSFGLLVCSATLAHLIHNTSMHFHFFVVLGFIAVYQSWRPYLLSIGFVLVHHAGLGLIAPEEVYGDAASIENPVLWAVVHALFVAAACVAQVAFWKFQENADDQVASVERQAALSAEVAAADLIAANLRREAAEALASGMEQRRLLEREVASQVNVLQEAAAAVNSDVQSIVTVVSQMSASVGTIAARVSDASSVAQTAASRADATTDEMTQLGVHSNEIERVLAVIGTIAQKTHLLALNASIEAARAGDAGRGFGVVAQEVKQLAEASRRSAQDIAQMVGTIQESTRGAIGWVTEVREVIGRMDQLQSVIADEVEQHTRTTQEISRALESAAGSTADIEVAVRELAGAARE